MHYTDFRPSRTTLLLLIYLYFLFKLVIRIRWTPPDSEGLACILFIELSEISMKKGVFYTHLICQGL